MAYVILMKVIIRATPTLKLHNVLQFIASAVIIILSSADFCVVKK